MGWSLGRHVRLLALWTGLLPFLLASLVASGVMPQRAANGVVELVLCTGHGIEKVAFDPVTMEPGSDQDKGQKDTAEPGYCLWAAGKPPLDLAPPTIIAQPLTVVRRAFSPNAATALAVAWATGLPPSTGPPSAV